MTTPRWAASMSDRALPTASISSIFLVVLLMAVSSLPDKLLIAFSEAVPSNKVTTSIAAKLIVSFFPIVMGVFFCLSFQRTNAPKFAYREDCHTLEWNVAKLTATEWRGATDRGAFSLDRAARRGRPARCSI